MLVSRPNKGQIADIIITDNYLILYYHTKGTHWNIGGTHYKYYHDINTGEFIPDQKLPVESYKEKVISKERFLVSDYSKIKSLKR